MPATRIATLRASWSAAAIARSSAIVRTSRQSGTTNDTTTVEVVAMTSHEMRRRMPGDLAVTAAGVDEPDTDPPHAVQVARLGRGLPSLRRSHDRCTSTVRSDPPYASCQTSASSSRFVTTSPGRDASASSRSNSLRASSSRSPASVAVRARSSITSSPTRTGSAGPSGPPLRRSTARIRAASWSVPNGFTT